MVHPTTLVRAAVSMLSFLATTLALFCELHPTYQGFRCDLTRTFVAGVSSPLQLEAWTHVADAHRLAQNPLQP